MIATKTLGKADTGFTLLELLIVTTILGLILVALTSGVRFAGQAWQVQERRSARQGDLDAVQNMLRQLMVSATDFQGDATSLRFISVLPRALARGGLYDVELRTSGDRLLLAWKPHFKGPAAVTPPTETELIKGVTGSEFAYYVRPTGWQRVLKAETRRPVLVSVNLQVGEGRAWPPLVVAPMIEDRQPTGNLE
jgi:general secretion pathway protein J